MGATLGAAGVDAGGVATSGELAAGGADSSGEPELDEAGVAVEGTGELEAAVAFPPAAFPFPVEPRAWDDASLPLDSVVAASER